ncbi:P44/Msp2 family outer membrane protein [Neoehrlichia mikurensis]|uniref:P44/Msp2 family outer membrane protein n=1 Tax=Neoehrlichia mikurensis TaxID=89586 RepID=A0A9Q9F3X7_9RICK|nr:P44/Msp2 family outer membrane protein [Neoehrlichia mikurensis]UTO55775.1 P44/Msp2 family outer membrane protein [Neoehrlichia mikurensis]
MNYMKLFIKFSIAVLLLPSLSMSAIIKKAQNNSGLYISANYNPSLHQFLNFKITESYRRLITAIYKRGEKPVSFNNMPNFRKYNLFAPTASIGYAKNNGLRTEFEVGYEKFNIKDKADKFITLLRSSYVKFSESVVVEIDAITTISLMANLCYDLHISKITPYACAGIGSNLVHITQNYIVPKLSYQIKAGINYPIAPKVSIFVGSFYHSVLDNKYTNIPISTPKFSQLSFNVNNSIANFNLTYFGGEIGIRIIL